MSHLAVISAAWLLSGLATAAERQPPPLAVAPFDAAKAKRHQQAWAEYLGVPVEITNSIGMKLILIPPGEYLMGSREGQGGLDDERPQHCVRITKPFYLGMYEVTHSQWERVMGSKRGRSREPMQPVTSVTWTCCQEFIRRLNGLPEERANVYRLPTEAEWEYACRAGSTTVYSFGDSSDALSDYAWYYDGKGVGSPQLVGQKRANAWGLYDMHGNVWEWCQDRYDSAYYASSPTDDPQGSGAGSSRVYRGGGWYDTAGHCRSANRDGSPPSGSSAYLGFRLAFGLVGPFDSSDNQRHPMEDALRQKASISEDAPRTADDQSVSDAAGIPQLAVAAFDDATAKRHPLPLAVAPFDAAEAKRHQQAWADYLGVPVEITNSIGMKLAFIPAGEFLMGSIASETMAGGEEKPQHTVRITKPFYLGVTEVTQEQYHRVMGSNPSFSKGAQLPVEQVTWDEAVEFCRSLSVLSTERSAGRVYRLPTEAEWEYACRAGTETNWSWGDFVSRSTMDEYAWYHSISGSKSHPVGQKKPNAWGLYDMHGNVREWCSDWWKRDYTTTKVSDPTGPVSGALRVVRGGGFEDIAPRYRSASRDMSRPSTGSRSLGFRIAAHFVD